MIQVIDGEIKQYKLPRTGYLKDGTAVSGYHLLDEETLKDEGWLPLEDIQPEYDEKTQYLIFDRYEILEDKVVKKYKIENIPEPQEPEPNEMDTLKTEITEEGLDYILSTIEEADTLNKVVSEMGVVYQSLIADSAPLDLLKDFLITM